MLGEWGALARLVERFEKVITPPLADAGDDYYAWHPYPVGLFLEGVHWAHRRLAYAERWDPGCIFIDVGCGIGTKMALASYMGWRVKGVELHPEYVEQARRLLPVAPIAVTNALEWTDYDAELVYSYRLCTDGDDQLALATHIAKHMRPGSLLFLPNSPVPYWLGDPLAPSIWEIP